MLYDSLVPKESMYGIFMYIWLIFMVNVGIHTIHGSYGVEDWDLKITSPNLISVGEFSCHGYPLALQKTLTSSLRNPGEHRGAEQVCLFM